MLKNYNESFVEIPLAELYPTVEKLKAEGARFVNLHATTLEDCFVLTYAFTTDENLLQQYDVRVTHEDEVPSISSMYLEAFVFENETHDLFGINIKDIAIDFQGNFYQVSVDMPMAVETDETENYVAEKAKKQGIGISYVEKGGNE